MRLTQGISRGSKLNHSSHCACSRRRFYLCDPHRASNRHQKVLHVRSHNTNFSASEACRKYLEFCTRPLEGLMILQAPTRTADGFEGQLYNAREGKSNTGRLVVAGKNSLSVTGCVMGFFCRTQTASVPSNFSHAYPVVTHSPLGLDVRWQRLHPLGICAMNIFSVRKTHESKSGICCLPHTAQSLR